MDHKRRFVILAICRTFEHCVALDGPVNDQGVSRALRPWTSLPVCALASTRRAELLIGRSEQELADKLPLADT